MMPTSHLGAESMSFECAAIAVESNHVEETAAASRVTHREDHGCERVEMLLLMATSGGSELVVFESNGKSVVASSPRLNFSTSCASHHDVQLMACIGIDTRSALW